MSIHSIESSHGLTQEQWSTALFKEHVEEIYFKQYMGSGMKSAVCVKEELEKGAGDQLTLPKAYLLDQDSGVTGQTTLEGKEQDMELGHAVFTAEVARNAVRFYNGMSEQRTAINTRDNAREILLEWKTQETDNQIFTKLTTSPTTNREVSADSTATHKAATSSSGVDDIATTDICTVKGIRRLKLHAITGNAGLAEKVKPQVDAIFGKQKFLLFLDPWSLQDLKADSDYEAYAKEDMTGRAKFFEGGVTEIDGVIIIECDKVPRVSNASSVMVAKNMLIGASACVVDWAGAPLMNGKKGRIQWAEKDFDYGNQYGIAIGDIKGVQKLKFNKEGAVQEDEGVILFYTASIAA